MLINKNTHLNSTTFCCNTVIIQPEEEKENKDRKILQFVLATTTTITRIYIYDCSTNHSPEKL